LVVPERVSALNHVLLAYNGSPKAKEALYLSAYLAGKWKIQLSVLVIEHEEIDMDMVSNDAQEYLKKHALQANFICHKPGTLSDIIIKTAQDYGCDFILMGGYKSSPVVEVVIGSVVDNVLRKTEIPLLICR